MTPLYVDTFPVSVCCSRLHGPGGHGLHRGDVLAHGLVVLRVVVNQPRRAQHLARGWKATQFVFEFVNTGRGPFQIMVVCT